MITTEPTHLCFTVFALAGSRPTPELSPHRYNLLKSLENSAIQVPTDCQHQHHTCTATKNIIPLALFFHELRIAYQTQHRPSKVRFGHVATALFHSGLSVPRTHRRSTFTRNQLDIYTAGAAKAATRSAAMGAAMHGMR